MSGPSPDRPLHGMFTALPPHYDLVNGIITWGLDRCWRRAAARQCLASSPQRVLDLGCGTGDLAVAVARLSRGGLEVVGLDYSQPMLDMARKKADRRGVEGLVFVHGDAANLPFPDGHFDCVGIAFAFRNLTYRNPLAQRALGEVLRVLRPGGRFVIVESSQPKLRVVRGLFRVYLRWFVSRVGYILSGNRAAYRYLAESAARFYAPGEVSTLLLGAGFSKVTCRALLLGAAGVHVAVK